MTAEIDEEKLVNLINLAVLRWGFAYTMDYFNEVMTTEDIMSTMLKEIYDALKEAGASEEKASAAAIAVAAHSLDREHLATLATKADLEQLRLATKADLAELKADIIKWMAGLVIGSMVAMTGIFAAIVKLL